MNYIDELLGKDGVFENQIKGYKPRPQQIKVTKAIHKAMDTKSHLVAEAPVATGKTFAYLIPAINYIVKHEKAQTPPKVIIVTANIALQEQLLKKDLPTLQRLFGEEAFTFAIAKGKNNYVCHKRGYEQSIKFPVVENKAEERTVNLDKLMNWLEETDTGDKSDLPFNVPEAAWNMVSVSGDECVGKSCSFYDSCFSNKARDVYEKANIIVTNYHMFLLHQKLMLESGGKKGILPKATVVIFDEAHKLPDITRDAFGFKISYSAISRLSGILDGIDQAGIYAGQRLERASNRFFEDLFEYLEKNKEDSRVKYGHKLNGGELMGALRGLAWQCRAEATKVMEESEKETLALVAGKAEEFERQIKIMLNGESDNIVSLVEDATNYNARDVVRRGALVGKAIDVSNILREAVFEKYDTVISVSATLSVGNSLEHFRKQIGLVGGEDVIVTSPFNYSKQVFAVIPREMPLPNEEKLFPDGCAEHINDVVRLAKGRTLALFTSRRNMEYCYERLKTKYKVLKQGDAPTSQLIAEFKENKHSVLFGLESFWAGVDVPGEALSCLIIDRIPFPTPNDPIVKALEDKKVNVFKDYSLPKAIIQLKQGFGRLIRSADDYGVVVFLDIRIAGSQYYAKQIRSSLPGLEGSSDIQDIEKWLDSKYPVR